MFAAWRHPPSKLLYNSGSRSAVSGPAACASAGNLLEMRTLQSHSDLLTSGTVWARLLGDSGLRTTALPHLPGNLTLPVNPIKFQLWRTVSSHLLKYHNNKTKLQLSYDYLPAKPAKTQQRFLRKDFNSAHEWSVESFIIFSHTCHWPPVSQVSWFPASSSKTRLLKFTTWPHPGLSFPMTPHDPKSPFFSLSPVKRPFSLS